MTTKTTEMVDVALDRISPNPWQPRTSMDPQYVAELAEDIHNVGLLQEPMARPSGDGVRYQLAFGHTRIEALRLLQESGRWGNSVLIKVEDLSDERMAYVALSENRARKQLTPMEEISAWAKAVREIDQVTVQSLADRVGLDRSTMSRQLAILDLPRSVLDLVDTGAMSLRAAQAFLALRNEDHCHEDHIELALQDLSGRDYHDRPPDYRTKTVRAAIRGVATGRHVYTWVTGLEEASRSWRPLEASKHHSRTISFDVEAFKAEFPSHVHVLPEGDESGGTEWTCNAREWGRWSSRASREATMAAKEGGTSPPENRPQNGSTDTAGEWWKAVKKDPLVQEVVGKRLRAMKTPADLTEEDRSALGSRVVKPNLNNSVRLPQAAQPEGITVKYDHAPTPPLFDFSQCAGCIVGAAWALPHFGSSQGQLVCTNKQAWMERQSVGVQAWVEWKNSQVEKDAVLDQMAITRLTMIDALDAKGLLMAMWDFVEKGEPVEPLPRNTGMDWDERTRYNYYPVGGDTFSQLTGVALPDLHGGYNRSVRWEREVNAWLTAVVGDVNWPMVLASVMVWKARVSLGLGEDIWSTVGMPTVLQETI